MTATRSLFDWVPPPPPAIIALATVPLAPPKIEPLAPPEIKPPAPELVEAIDACRTRALPLLPRDPVMAVCAMVRGLRADPLTADLAPHTVAFSLRSLLATHGADTARSFIEGFA